MLNWIIAHAEILSVATSLGTLIVWITYLQLFVSSYRRQTRPKILINRGGAEGLDARCLVSNMSSDSIYLQSIILDLALPNSHQSCPVTELDGWDAWETPSDLNLWTRQGPLGAGKVRDMGSFRAMLSHAFGEAVDDSVRHGVWGDIEAFEVRIIAEYASEDLPIGAKRRFEVHRDGNRIVLKPQMSVAVQIRSKRERKAIKRLLEDELR